MHYAFADCPYVANISDRLLHVVEDVTDVIACLGTIPDLFNNYVDFMCVPYNLTYIISC